MAIVFGLENPIFLAKSDIFIPKCTEGGSTGLKIFPLCELSVHKKGVATFSANMFAFVGTPLFVCTVQGGGLLARTKALSIMGQVG